MNTSWGEGQGIFHGDQKKNENSENPFEVALAYKNLPIVSCKLLKFWTTSKNKIPYRKSYHIKRYSCIV